jgi:hypothetical protein
MRVTPPQAHGRGRVHAAVRARRGDAVGGARGGPAGQAAGLEPAVDDRVTPPPDQPLAAINSWPETASLVTERD